MIKEKDEKKEVNVTDVNQNKSVEQKKPVEQKERVKVNETLMEAMTQRYHYRLVLKEWAKGVFYSLERGDIVETLDHKKGLGRPNKMFTLPTDEDTLTAIIAGIQKIPMKPSKKQT